MWSDDFTLLINFNSHNFYVHVLFERTICCIHDCDYNICFLVRYIEYYVYIYLLYIVECCNYVETEYCDSTGNNMVLKFYVLIYNVCGI